jgi:hypothetical protein
MRFVLTARRVEYHQVGALTVEIAAKTTPQQLTDSE